ncbi:YhbY family RNA-binding protein [Nanoarchaeota archaeon]
MINKDLKTKANLLEPVLRIGKNGLTDNVIEEIILMLKKRKLIKIKFLKSAMDKSNRTELFDKILKETQAELISKTGNVIVIYRK